MGPELIKQECPVMFDPRGKLNKLIHNAAMVHGTTSKRVRGRSLLSCDIAARQEVWRRLYWLGWSYSAIGRAFDRDHTTIMAGVDSAEGRIS